MNYHRIAPPARWRWRRIRRVSGGVLLLALWVGGTAWCVGDLMADHPDPTWQQGIAATVVFALLWGAALRLPQYPLPPPSAWSLRVREWAMRLWPLAGLVGLAAVAVLGWRAAQ